MFEKFVAVNKLVVIVIVFNTFSSIGQLARPKCLDGNCKNKIGTYIYSDSSIYVGEFNDHLKSGLGRITFRNKSYYEGQWINDKRNGQGVYIDSLGNKYEGNWVDDKESGKGKYTDIKGNIYEGTWTSGELMGSITIDYRNKNYYQGEYKQGLNGNGKLMYADGSIYTGSFNKNRRSGFGEMVYNFGLTYKGNWVSNEVEGMGDFYETKTQLKIATGKWKIEKTKEGDLKFLNDSGYLVCYLANKNLYFGNSLNGTFEGNGRLVFSNGEIYEGDFVKGEFNGNGKYTYKDKSDYKGEWKNNLKNGYGVQTNFNKSVIEGYWNDDKYIGAKKRVELASFNDCPKSCTSNSENSNYKEADRRVGNCSNNLKQGEWKDIDENGRVLRVQNYRNGILDGVQTDYYRNGEIEEIKKYKNGLLEGDRITYRDDGKIRYKFRYLKGILVDTAFFYGTTSDEKYFLEYILIFDTTNLQLFSHYKNVYNIDCYGRCDIPSKYFSYHNNGKIHEQSLVLDGDRYGNSSRYDDKGNLIAELLFETLEYVEVFDVSKIVSGWEMKSQEDDNGLEIISKKVTYDNKPKQNEIISKSFFNDGGVFEFEEKTYYENGKIKKIECPNYSYNVTYIDKESSNEGVRQRLIQEYSKTTNFSIKLISSYSSLILFLNLGDFKIEGNYPNSNGKKYFFKSYVLNSIMVDSIYDNNSLCAVISLSADNDLIVKHYYPNGKLKYSCNYIDYNINYCFKKSDYESFVANGEVICYYDNGKVKLSATFDKGEIKGKVTLYDQNGNKKEYSANELSETDNKLLRDIERNQRLINF